MFKNLSCAYLDEGAISTRSEIQAGLVVIDHQFGRNTMVSDSDCDFGQIQWRAKVRSLPSSQNRFSFNFSKIKHIFVKICSYMLFIK